jgi:hypothetical protein
VKLSSEVEGVEGWMGEVDEEQIPMEHTALVRWGTASYTCILTPC